MSEQLRSLRHERDVREHGDAVTTRPWWNAPGEESRAMVWQAEMDAWRTPDTELLRMIANSKSILGDTPARKPIRILANPRPFT